VGLRSIAVAGTVTAVLAALVVAGPAAPAEAKSRFTPCIVNGTNVQEKYGLSVSVVTPDCNQIQAGSWTTGIGWYSAKTWQAIPAGYHPEGATPIEDFVAHFGSMKLVIDGGTSKAFTVEWSKASDLWRGSDADWDYANTITLGTVRKLPLGSHTVARSLVLTALTCDGTSADPSLSCVPAGETYVDTLSFTVIR
jgi:hypothetical protein